MALYLVGIGLCSEKDLSLKAVDMLRKCDAIYLESYTSKLSVPASSYESLIGKKIIIADRELIEQRADSEIIERAKENNVAVLFPGDALAATTHNDLILRAKEKNVACEVVPNSSIITAVGITGLQIYKFGKTTSIPIRNEDVFSPYDILMENLGIGAHTLFLLEYDPISKDFISVNKAIQYLLSVEDKISNNKIDNNDDGNNKNNNRREKKLIKEKLFSKKTLCVGVARLGCSGQVIMAGSAEELLKNDFGDAPHCLIVAGKLHFKEEEGLDMWR